MTDTTPEAAFAAALAKFQEELPHVTKGQTAKVPTKAGGSYSYDYADLTDITNAAAPLLSKNGLSWSARPTVIDGVFVLRYSLLHTEGHREAGDYPLPDPARSSPQEIGSALTYARRYALCAVTGIAPGGDDDDGQKASEARSADRLPSAPRTRGATTRRPEGTLGDPATRDDAWTTDTERVTDTTWLEGWRTRLTACTKPGEVRGLDTEAHAQYGAGKLTADDARDVQRLVKERLAELQPQAVDA